MSANKLPGVKQERTNDRIGAVVFSTYGKISVKEKTKKEVEASFQNFKNGFQVILFSLKS